MKLPPLFQQQIALEEWESTVPARVAEVHRSRVTLWLENHSLKLDWQPAWPPLAVGDWLLLDQQHRFVRLLDRQSVFRRKAAGARAEEQLIASNVDTVFIVTGMNDDFNLNRLERYLALANEASSEPVVVLTRADLCQQPDQFFSKASALSPALAVVMLNGLDQDSCRQLEPWLATGQTVAMLGSSGAGKSTLLNTLLGAGVQQTRKVREADSKGRHTTTSRSMHQLPGGAMIIDTPGMRELQLAFVAEGIEQTFSDISELASSCRFGDCRHGQEPGCAVRRAIESGELDERRLVSYQKLQREDERNSASVAQRRAADRKLGKFYKSVISQKQKKGG